MGTSLIALLRNLAAVGLSVLALNAQPALAQRGGNDPLYVTASFATFLSRYYAPYALQATAAYLPVKDFDDARRAAGADVELATSPYASDPAIQSRARKFLRAWQYQFGSEGYLTCFDSDPDCQKAIRADRWTFAVSGGPTFQVWARTRYPQRENTACSEVSIAFRGTEGTLADWISNLSPVTSFAADDYYRQLRRNVDAIIKRITALDCYKRARRSPQIVSVGHSLGGGLAQMAALANNPGRPRIAKVFAFDPSPITGAPLVDRHTLAQNAQGLEVDRIYQTGEVLQRLRRVAQQFPKQSSTCGPQVRTVVYDALQPTGSVALHNMAGLAGQMVQLSYSGETQLAYAVPQRTTCRTRYLAPATDQDAPPEPGPDVVASAPAGSAFARGDWFGGGWQAAQSEGSTRVRPVRLKAHGASARLKAAKSRSAAARHPPATRKFSRRHLPAA